jgi:RNA polymerase sigma-70 factor (ECF subfamily)
MVSNESAVAASIYDEDKALADAVRRRDRKATAALVDEHADTLYAYIAARVHPNLIDADDLTQDVFLAAWQSIGNYRGSSSLKAWLLGIARHKVEDYYRARVHVVDIEDAEFVPAADVHLDAALDGDRLRKRTEAALDRLPEHYRLLLKWRYWDQKRTAEIASALGRTEKSVERMLARAREQFRSEWEAES